MDADSFIFYIKTEDIAKEEEGTKKCVIKRKIKFEDCLEVVQLENKVNQLQKQKKNSVKLNQIIKLKNYEEFIKTINQC